MFTTKRDVSRKLLFCHWCVHAYCTRNYFVGIAYFELLQFISMMLSPSSIQAAAVFKKHRFFLVCYVMLLLLLVRL